MHQISFELKRGHLRTVAWGEQAMASVPGMTAARFDLLCLIRQKSIIESKDPNDALRLGLSQKLITQLLDLSKATISIMLKRLERIGWVRRSRGSGESRRTNMVYLTPKGLRCIAKAMRIMFRQRAMLKYFEDIFKKVRPYCRKHVVTSLHRVWKHLHFIACIFGDRSSICYEMGDKLEDGLWDFSWRTPRPRDELYQPPPRAKKPPVPLKGDQRDPDWRPFTFTPYENALRAFIWGTEKRRRRRKAPAPTPTPSQAAERT